MLKTSAFFFKNRLTKAFCNSIIISVAGTNGVQMEWYAAVAHLVERHLAKVEVASSSLVGRSICGSLAQLGEHLPYKQRVSGSSPLTPTKKVRCKSIGLFIFYNTLKCTSRSAR